MYMVARARRNFNKPQRPQLPAHARFLKRDAKLFIYPKRQVLSTPAHYAVDCWDRPDFNNPRKGLPLCVIELGRLARRLAVNQTSWSLGVEPENPVADDLQPDSANPRRVLAPAAIVNLGQRKKPPALSPILRRLGQPTQNRPIKIIPQRNRSTHGEPPNLFTILIQTFERLGIP